MADVVHVPPGHIPAVQQVQRREDIAGNRDGNQVDVDAHLRLEEDRCEQDGRDGAGSADRIVARAVPVFYQVTDGRHRNGAHVKDDIQDYPQRVAEGQAEILLDHAPEEIQGEHVEEQMSPSAVNQAVGEHPVPLFPMPHLGCVEYQGLYIQLPGKAQDAHGGGNQYDDDRDHILDCKDTTFVGKVFDLRMSRKMSTFV